MKYFKLLGIMSLLVFSFLNFIIFPSPITSSGIDFVNDPVGGDAIANEIRTQVSLYNRKEDWVAMMGYGIMYITFVWYIVIFTWKFIKRVIYMAFLTFIAPMVALTYPIDKAGDRTSTSL